MKDWSYLENLNYKLHVISMVCSKCNSVYTDMFYVSGDYSTCSKCGGLNIHQKCSMCVI